jgi:hypothetical protein
MDFLLREAQQLLGGADPNDVADATADHVADVPSDELAQHLADGAQNMDQGSLASLGQSLLSALSAHGHDESQVQDAGVDTAAAADGDQDSVMALIEHAQQNPGALRDAAVSYVQQNPQMLSQLPGLLSGVMGRLRG